MNFVLLGNHQSPRIAGFQAALEKLNLPAAKLILWRDFLRGEIQLGQAMQGADFLRIESPGRDWEVEKLLLKRGAALSEIEGEFAWLPREKIEKLTFEKGRLWPSRQWFFGLKSALHEIEMQLQNASHNVSRSVSHSARDIEIMFDKPRCQALLQNAKIEVPRILGIAQNFDDLTQKMRAANCRRAFIKLAHGSSAAGVVAYETNEKKHRAVTTTQVVRSENNTRLYHSRRVRTLTDLPEISQLIDALCQHRAHAEAWIPKANFASRSCDMRVVVIGGKARHKIVRLAKHPLTNLHLLNERADGELLREKVSPQVWRSALHDCEKAMQCFPDSLCGGVDLLFAPGFGRHAILEVNAWGDLLQGALHEGQTTYEAQIRALRKLAP